MKTIVVIGGSKGIGQAVVKEQLAHNNVVSISRTLNSLEHPNFTQYVCNILTDELPVLPNVDALVYCPGSINLKPFKRMSVNDFTDDYEINVLGAVKAVQNYLPQLSESSKQPSIVLFSSVAVKMGMPFHTSISAAKGALEGFAKSLAAELVPSIRVNCIAPTLTDTDLSSRILRNDKLKLLHAERHPLKKYVEPEEVAEMVGFLMSDKAMSFSGQIFEMDCGLVNLKV